MINDWLELVASLLPLEIIDQVTEWMNQLIEIAQ